VDSVMIWHPFFEIRAKVKTFLRLSNLHPLNLDQKVDTYISTSQNCILNWNTKLQKKRCAWP
jgi:hypothetical protein